MKHDQQIYKYKQVQLIGSQNIIIKIIIKIAQSMSIPRSNKKREYQYQASLDLRGPPSTYLNRIYSQQLIGYNPESAISQIARMQNLLEQYDRENDFLNRQVVELLNRKKEFDGKIGYLQYKGKQQFVDLEEMRTQSTYNITHANTSNATSQKYKALIKHYHHQQKLESISKQRQRSKKRNDSAFKRYQYVQSHERASSPYYYKDRYKYGSTRAGYEYVYADGRDLSRSKSRSNNKSISKDISRDKNDFAYQDISLLNRKQSVGALAYEKDRSISRQKDRQKSRQILRQLQKQKQLQKQRQKQRQKERQRQKQQYKKKYSNIYSNRNKSTSNVAAYNYSTFDYKIKARDNNQSNRSVKKDKDQSKEKENQQSSYIKKFVPSTGLDKYRQRSMQKQKPKQRQINNKKQIITDKQNQLMKAQNIYARSTQKTGSQTKYTNRKQDPSPAYSANQNRLNYNIHTNTSYNNKQEQQNEKSRASSTKKYQPVTANKKEYIAQANHNHSKSIELVNKQMQTSSHISKTHKYTTTMTEANTANSTKYNTANANKQNNQDNPIREDISNAKTNIYVDSARNSQTLADIKIDTNNRDNNRNQQIKHSGISAQSEREPQTTSRFINQQSLQRQQSQQKPNIIPIIKRQAYITTDSPEQKHHHNTYSPERSPHNSLNNSKNESPPKSNEKDKLRKSKISVVSKQSRVSVKSPYTIKEQSEDHHQDTHKPANPTASIRQSPIIMLNQREPIFLESPSKTSVNPDWNINKSLTNNSLKKRQSQSPSYMGRKSMVDSPSKIKKGMSLVSNKSYSQDNINLSNQPSKNTSNMPSAKPTELTPNEFSIVPVQIPNTSIAQTPYMQFKSYVQQPIHISGVKQQIKYSQKQIRQSISKKQPSIIQKQKQKQKQLEHKKKVQQPQQKPNMENFQIGSFNINTIINTNTNINMNAEMVPNSNMKRNLSQHRIIPSERISQPNQYQSSNTTSPNNNTKKQTTRDENNKTTNIPSFEPVLPSNPNPNPTYSSYTPFNQYNPTTQGYQTAFILPPPVPEPQQVPAYNPGYNRSQTYTEEIPQHKGRGLLQKKGTDPTGLYNRSQSKEGKKKFINLVSSTASGAVGSKLGQYQSKQDKAIPSKSLISNTSLIPEGSNLYAAKFLKK